MTEDLVVGIVVTVVGGLIVAVLLSLWARRRKPGEWLDQQKPESEEREQYDDAEQLPVLREQVPEVARQRGVVLPASSTGRVPTIITFTDGNQSFYFDDFARYGHAVQDRRVPPTRSFRRAAPTPVSRWDRATLMRWLDEHTTQQDGEPGG